MIAWATVEDAIHAWVVAGSGLAADRVIWAGQNSPRPPAPYIAMSYEIDPFGQDWRDVEDAAAPTEGAEIEIHTRGTRVLLLELQAFAASPVGPSSAVALLAQVGTAARRSANLNALNTAGVGFASHTRITDISAVLGGAEWEPRALVEMRCYLSADVADPATYISAAHITNESTGVEQTVGTPGNPWPVVALATAGDGEVILTWTGGDGAISFSAFWGVAPGVDPETAAELPAITSPHTHTGLANGTPYYYVIVATSEYGTTSQSAEVSATPSA